MKRIALAIVAAFSLSTSVYAQNPANFNFNIVNPQSIVDHVKALDPKMRDSIVQTLDTIQLKNIPISTNGFLSKKLENEMRETIGGAIQLVKNFLKSPGDLNTFASRMFDCRYKIESFGTRISYEMNVKSMKEDFAQEKFDNRKDRREAQKDLKQDLADEKRNMKDELRSLRENINEEKKQYLQNLKA